MLASRGKTQFIGIGAALAFVVFMVAACGAGATTVSTAVHSSLPPSSSAAAVVPVSRAVSAAPIATRGPRLLRGPDPKVGRPFSTAGLASAAAGGLYVPDCGGHTDFFLQPNGAVVTFFQGNDAQLWVYPPGGPFVSGPIPPNSVVTPQKVVVQGQVGYGYEATPQLVQVSATHVEGVLVRSYLTWSNHGSSIQLLSDKDLSLAQLQQAANSCN